MTIERRLQPTELGDEEDVGLEEGVLELGLLQPLWEQELGMFWEKMLRRLRRNRGLL